MIPRRSALIFVWLAALALAPRARAAEQVLDAVAAQVGSGIVLLSEVNELANPIEERMRKAGAPAQDIRTMRADALERLIDSKLIEAMVARMELSASDDEVDRAIAGIAADTGLTTDQLAASVTSHGLTLDAYREKIRNEIERTKVLNAVVRSRVEVLPEEVESLYQEKYGSQPSGGREFDVRHIMVGIDEQSGRTRELACGKATAGLARLRAGTTSFPELAREISDANRESGGDMGWLHESEMAGWMAKALAGLDPGGVSGVIEMPFGCNLLQLVDRRDFSPVTLEQARPALEQQVFRRKSEEAYRDWIEEMRKQTYIERKGVFAQIAGEQVDLFTQPPSD